MADAVLTSFAELKSGTETHVLRSIPCNMLQAKEDGVNSAVTSPLFKIPLELRIEIYCYLLRSPRVICVRNSPHVRNEPPYEFVSVGVVQCKAAKRGAMFSQPRLNDELLQRKTILGKSPKKEIESAILLVSRQMFVEARYLIYSENSFAFHVAETLWVSAIGDKSRYCSLAEEHQRQYQASKHTVILTKRPKNNQVEILSVRGVPSCPEPVEFFQNQSRDFRFMKNMIFGYTMLPRNHHSWADTMREHIFRGTCHYISQRLQLVHLTLIVNSDSLATWPVKEYEDLLNEGSLAKVPLMQWVQCLVPIVTNLRVLHISIPGAESLEKAVMDFLQPKMLKMRNSVQQSEPKHSC